MTWWVRIGILACILGFSAGCDPAEGRTRPLLGGVRLESSAPRGMVRGTFDLGATGGGRIEVAFFYACRGGEFRPATTSTGLGGGGGWLVGPETEPFPFVWDSASDVGALSEPASCVFRVTARASGEEVQAESPAFRLHNDNRPPAALIGELTPDDPEGVRFAALLADDAGPVTLRLAYSLDGGATFSEAALSPSDDTFEADEEGTPVTLLWKAAEDLDFRSYPNLLLRLTPADDLGEGTPGISKSFSYSPPEDRRIDLLLPPASGPATYRGRIPIEFKLFGSRSEHFDIEVRLVVPDQEGYSTLRRLAGPTWGLAASPDGTSHRLEWDAHSEFSLQIVRNLLITVDILDDSGGLFDPRIFAQTGLFHLNNAQAVSTPLLSEIFFGGELGEGAFVELSAAPGTSLEGLRLYEVRRNGFTGESVNEGFLLFSPEQEASGRTPVVGPEGFFLVAGPDRPDADFIWDRFGTFFRHGRPTNLLLDDPSLPYTYDAAGIGDFEHCELKSSGCVFTGEGSPAPLPGDGLSLTRDFSNTDLNHNALDFIPAEPTPGRGTRVENLD